MAESRSGRDTTMWTIGIILVLFFALIPVLWITSLSFKTTATLTDGNFIPREWTLDNYRTIFQTDQFVRALANSIPLSQTMRDLRDQVRADLPARKRRDLADTTALSQIGEWRAAVAYLAATLRQLANG